MVEATYDEVRNHLDRLISGVRNELAFEARELRQLDDADEHRFVSRLLLLDIVLVNILLCLVLPEYPLYWITASFFLYVINPFLLLIPSGNSKPGVSKRGIPSRITDRIRDLGITEHKLTIARVFWNSFFINSQPLVPAFLGIYGINIVFSFTRNLGTLGWLVVFQSAAILVFYLAIAVFRPYTGGFLESLIDIQNDVYGKIHRHIEPFWQVMLPIGLVAGFVALVLIAAMLLPGFTLGVIWKSEATVTGVGFLPVLFVLASQVIVVRYVQGASSRGLVRQLKERKRTLLKKHVLEPLETYRNQLDVPASGAIDRFAKDFADIRATFLSSKVYQTQAQDLYGLFPIYIVIPDLDLILNRETIRLLDEQPGSRQVL
jgi:hypothetical protein